MPALHANLTALEHDGYKEEGPGIRQSTAVWYQKALKEACVIQPYIVNVEE
jgi:hypothetical protein